MSFVGTRPEVTKYVKKYTKEISIVFSTRHVNIFSHIVIITFK